MMKGARVTMLFKLFVVCLLLTVAGCGDEPTYTAPKTSSKKVRPVKAPPVKAAAVEEEQKDIFAYNPIGQRDPFESLLKKETESRQAGVPKTPLEKFDLGQFRVQAILIGKGVPRAMVTAPDGKNYILKPGLKIGKNNGVISDINRTEVVVEESTIDLAGNPVKGFQYLTIPEKKTF
jgi:type IV pilus assembly protein PilP